MRYNIQRIFTPSYWLSLIPEAFGYHLVNWSDYYNPMHVALVENVQPYTMVRALRLLSVCDAVEYVNRRKIDGSWVECGVWKGGASLLAAMLIGDRPVWMYDFEDNGAKELVELRCPEAKVHFILGDVLEAIPSYVPDQIAILRLDTNSYDSTLHELTHLYPILSSGGVLLLDDWCLPEFRKAVMEYFNNDPPFISRSDYTGALLIKP